MCLTTGGKFKPQIDAVQLQYENVYPKGQADPDNQLPDKWNSIVFQSFRTFR
jgi:hypothetical protein